MTFPSGFRRLLFIIGIAISWNSWGAIAAPTLTTFDSNSVTSTAYVPISYMDLGRTMTTELSKILKRASFVREATFLGADEKVTRLNKKGTNRTTEGMSTYRIQIADTRLLPESLFSVKSTYTECLGGPTDEENKNPCVPGLSLTLRGPIAHYREYFSFSNPVSLNDSFEIVINVSPKDTSELGGPSTVTVKLNILNRDYMEYLASLTRTQTITEMPTEKQLKMGFSFWANQLILALQGQ